MSAGRTLEVLVRLHRRELDLERRRLAELDDRIAELEATIEAFQAERARELDTGAERPESGPFLGGYLEGSRRREAGLRAELGELRAQRSAAAERIRGRLAEAKRYEILAARAAARAALDARRREQRELDELANRRRGERGPV